MYKISLIIVLENSEKSIKKLFESIKEQSIGFKNIELICLYNTLNNNILKYIKKLEQKNCNVKLFNIKTDNIGKMFNFGINKSTTNYLMFLRDNVSIYNETCEYLYNLVSNNNVDFVSGNSLNIINSTVKKSKWSDFELDNIIETSSSNIHENIFLLPSNLSSKMYNKKFLTLNHIMFNEEKLLLDLIFVYQTLLCSNKTIYVNQTLSKNIVNINYNKQILIDMVDSYYFLTKVFDEYNKKYSWLSNIHLKNWVHSFIATDLSIKDRLEIIKYSQNLFNLYNHNNNKNSFYKISDETKIIFDLIKINLLKDAAIVSNYLSKKYSDCNISFEDKNIFFLFFGLQMEVGGLAKAIFNRANILSEKGLNITLINVEPYVNRNIFDLYVDTKYAIDHFREIGYLNNKIKFINIFDYFEKMNTKNSDNIFVSNEYNLPFVNNICITSNYIIQRKILDDLSENFWFYDIEDYSENELFILKEFMEEPYVNIPKNMNMNEIFSKKLIKKEKYLNNSLTIVEEYDSTGKLEQTKFFTRDGFNYLIIQHYNQDKYILKNVFSKSIIEFNNIQDFIEYFVQKICLDSSKKPFLVNDCSGPIPNLESISHDYAYLIGNLHSNPYLESHCYGSKMRNISILKNVYKLDALVTLTNSEGNDLKKEFNSNNIFVIPNILNFDEIIKTNVNNIEKNNYKFSIFARVSPEKNIEDAIRAIAIVKNKYPDVELHVYGRALSNDELKVLSSLRKIIGELNVEKNIFFEGHVENVFEEMKSSLATLLVSDIEGMPMVILESMINEVPVLCYDIHYGPKDIINNYVDGLIVKQYDVKSLAEQMSYLLEHPEKSIEMGKNARKSIIEKYSFDLIYDSWLNVFKHAYINNHLREFNEKIELKEKEKELNNILNNEKSIKTLRRNLNYKKNNLNKSSDKLNKQKSLLKEKNFKIRTSEQTFKYYRDRIGFKYYFFNILPYLYLIYNKQNILINFRLYRALINSEWFDVGYYIYCNPDLSRKWFKFLTPLTHFVCFGFDEKRKPFAKYEDKYSKIELLSLIRSK